MSNNKLAIAIVAIIATISCIGIISLYHTPKWTMLQNATEHTPRGRILAYDGTPLAYTEHTDGIYDTRRYPLGRVASSLIGHCVNDVDESKLTIGLCGLEYVYDDELAEGHDITTTIDPLRQESLHSRLEALRIDTQSELAWGVEMCISNEAVLAIASIPDYDPHRPREFIEKSAFNWAVVRAFHPGNTIRPLLASINDLDEIGVKARLKKLGFGEPLGGYFNEAPGEVDFTRSWSPWCYTNVVNGSFPSVTSLQLARAFCRLAQEGNCVRESYSCRPLMRVKNDSRIDNSNYLQTLVITDGDRVTVLSVKAPQKQNLKKALGLGINTGNDDGGEMDPATVMAIDEYP